MRDLVEAASTKTLLDEFMPVSDVAAAYEVVVEAPAAKVYESLLRHSLLDSRLARFLMAVRSLPGALAGLLRGRSLQRFCLPTLGKIEASNFVKLAERPGEEMVLGLIGRFWKLRGGLVPVKTADEFIAFDPAGYTKAVVNVRVVPAGGGSCRLSTETRVRATDAISRRRFLRYWTLVGPFSGLLRRDMLRRIKREAEG